MPANKPPESWKIRIQGAGSDDYIGMINRVGLEWAEQTWTLTATTPDGSPAWTNTLDTQAFKVWLAEESGGFHIIDLDYAKLDIFGTKPKPEVYARVSELPLPSAPLPAAAWFLLTALGGLFGARWLRGRKAVPAV